MDPYLESRWLAVHNAFIAESWRKLNQTLPDDLFATMEERVAVDTDAGSARRIGPDVFIADPSGWRGAPCGTVVLDAPIRLEVESEPVIERFVNVVNQDEQLITVVEFLSPSNKMDPGSQEFRKKRRELFDAGVHLVEIDLVRGGDWLDLFEPRPFPPAAVSTYRAVVRTATGRPAVYIFPIRLQDPLPNVPVPLRAGDPEVFLPLQQMVESIYSDGRYGRTLKYDRPLDPPLWPDEAAYAAERLAARATMAG
jgi:hypothetical protein